MIRPVIKSGSKGIHLAAPVLQCFHEMNASINNFQTVGEEPGGSSLLGKDKAPQVPESQIRLCKKRPRGSKSWGNIAKNKPKKRGTAACKETQQHAKKIEKSHAGMVKVYPTLGSPTSSKGKSSSALVFDPLKGYIDEPMVCAKPDINSRTLNRSNLVTMLFSSVAICPLIKPGCKGIHHHHPVFCLNIYDTPWSLPHVIWIFSCTL